MSDHTEFPKPIDPLLQAATSLLAARKQNAEVRIVAAGVPSVEISHTEIFANEVRHHFRFVFSISSSSFEAPGQQEREAWEAHILAALKEADESVRIFEVKIRPGSVPIEDWRQKALEWLEKPTNQGRGHSQNIASVEHDFLLFRSQREVNLYMELKRLEITMAPLPVFVKREKKEKDRRVEPDFLLIHEGVVLVVEVDSKTYHSETPAEADRRLEPLRLNGARVERVRADECVDGRTAKECAQKLLQRLKQYAKLR